jgi:glycosyltransferase involved in cell wall biosynthesis
MAGTRDSEVTVLIEARNEQDHLRDCIRSAKLLTNSIILIDQHSTDHSVEIAREEGVTIYEHEPVQVVEEIREYGINRVKTPWVFILDADERITEELANEIRAYVADVNANNSHLRVNRENIFGNTWLRHGGWWPDPQTRLINVKNFISWPKAIHSTVQLKGDIGMLEAPLLHHFHGNLHTMVEKTILFEEVEAELLHKAGRKSGTLIFMRKFCGELWRRLIKNKGFMDGAPGIIESIYQAYSKTVTYLYLYEKNRTLRSVS